MLTGVTSFDCALHRLIHKSFVTTAHRAGERRGFDLLVTGPWHGPVLTVHLPGWASLQMTGGHNLFRLFALVICDHCPLPPSRRMSRTLILCLQFPIETTTLRGQLADKTMTLLPRGLFLYCTAMVANVYPTPTFPLHYGDNVKVKSQHIYQAIPALLRGLGEAVVTNDWCIIYSL